VSGAERDRCAADLLTRVQKRTRQRAVHALAGMRGDLARCRADLGAVVARHPLWCAAGAVGTGMIAVVLVRRRSAPAVPQPVPAPPSVLRRLLIAVVLPAIRSRVAAAFAQR
jgi:hypothetical protein